MSHTRTEMFESTTGPRRRIGHLHERFARFSSARRLARFGPAVLAILAWTAVGLFQSVPEMLKGFHWDAFIGKLIDAWAWALLTPAILLIDRRLNSGQQSVARLVAMHLLLSIPFTLLHTYVSGLLLYPLPEIWWSPLRSSDYAPYFFLGGWVTYCAFVGILQAFRFYNRLLTSQVELERVAKRLVESQLNALRLQLEPHFLFNTLNAISSEVAENPGLAREMIEDLGALLRRSLDCQGSTEISLAQELALVDHYVSIQRRRFGNRLHMQIDVEPAALCALVPSMLLQPLIENAIRHGIEGRLSGGTIVVSARRRGDQLDINIIDDGVGLPASWQMESSGGLGIRVTRERLEALYPGTGEDRFTISRRQGGGTDVAIHIPLNRMGADPRATAV